MTNAPRGVTDKRLPRRGFLKGLFNLCLALAVALLIADMLRRTGILRAPEIVIDFIAIVAFVAYAPRYFIRRLHDLGFSGWWLITVIPVIPVVAGLAWLFGALGSELAQVGIVEGALVMVLAAFVWLGGVRGAVGPNKYGDDPLDPAGWWVKDRGDGPVLTARTIRSRMRRLAQPTLLLIPTKDDRFSKLGGRPDLPEGLAWPDGAKGSRAFVAQLDLSEVRAADGPDWLPPEGRLYVFYDDERAGCADHVSVVFSQSPAGGEAPTPPGLSTKLCFNERRVSFMPLTSIPSLDWLDVDLRALDVDDDELDQLANAPDEPYGDELQHRIGGYPSEIQNGQLALECEHLVRGLPMGRPGPNTAIARAARQWRLLLQVDSDPSLDMNWIDTGRLYVFIREQDARAVEPVIEAADGVALARLSKDTAVLASLLETRGFEPWLLVGHSKGCLVISEALYWLRERNPDRAEALGKRCAVALFCARIGLPPMMARVADITGEYDAFGALNSRADMPADLVVPRATHSTNRELPFGLGLDVAAALRAVEPLLDKPAANAARLAPSPLGDLPQIAVSHLQA